MLLTDNRSVRRWNRQHTREAHAISMFLINLVAKLACSYEDVPDPSADFHLEAWNFKSCKSPAQVCNVLTLHDMPLVCGGLPA